MSKQLRRQAATSASLLPAGALPTPPQPRSQGKTITRQLANGWTEVSYNVTAIPAHRRLAPGARPVRASKHANQRMGA